MADGVVPQFMTDDYAFWVPRPLTEVFYAWKTAHLAVPIADCSGLERETRIAEFKIAKPNPVLKSGERRGEDMCVQF